MTTAGKTIVLIRTSSVARIPVYKHIRSLGIRVIIVHPFQNPAFEGCYDDFLVHDTNDIDALENAIVKFQEEKGIDTVDAFLSFDEYGVYPAAVLSERRSKRSIPLSPSALQATSVKSAFRTFCYANGINSPASAAIYTPTDDVDAAIAHIAFPVVIKPSPGAGSLLAKLCNTVTDLKRHAQYMWSVLSGHPDVKHLNALGTPVHLLIEEYIGGQEVDIDCAIENGVVRFISISDNFEVQPPYFVESGGVCPSRLGEKEQQALADLLESFLKAHGSSCHGVLHFEAKYDFERQKAYVIEVNCRMGSAETNTMILSAYGVQLGECLVRLGLGLPLENITETSHIVKKHCASVNIYPKAEGALKHVAVSFGDKALVDYSISATPGTLVALPPKSFFLLCWMVAQGTNSDEAIANIRRLTGEFVQEIVSAQ
ncbi:Hypothetical protein, putative [Bodo saltans]|uniref:ATP-grasp domain-containing protein n=1 Tax=Bodo saltans TaxID=75058 RepID=A0A0S4JCU0_BODSA|nr:Hypothetical protein, putative [Bodo saltans]|eukprot:CUG88063.1 Hypothetical protein, putative [Bodo saltans]